MDELDQVVTNATPEEPDSVRTVVATYEEALTSTSNSSSDLRSLRWQYYRPIANLLEKTALQHGWAFYDELLATYSPRNQFGVSACSHVLVNGVGRFVIRTRYRDDVEAVPGTALRYLRAYSSVSDHFLARQEAWTYGWGIGHPSHSVAMYLQESVEDNPRWVQSALEQAFYADQAAATDLLERLVTDESIEFSVQLTSDRTVPKERFLIECLVGPDRAYEPTVPRYWEWWDESDYIFDWNPSIDRD
ncbi:hypothetical protein [Halospeciosus flavus]|uniref:hypothetical protein n=1 Tax=Halospeciosus flavus TaxID=3032283 RepID=UPI00360B3A3E